MRDARQASPLLLAGVTAAIGYGMIRRGIGAQRDEGLAPQRTIESVREGKAWVERKVASRAGRKQDTGSSDEIRRDIERTRGRTWTRPWTRWSSGCRRASSWITGGAHCAGRVAARATSASDAADWAADRLPDGDDVEDARDRASDAAGQAKAEALRGARRAQRGFLSLLEEQPLALGAISFGLGIAAGVAAPTTRWEDEDLTTEGVRTGPAPRPVRRATRCGESRSAVNTRRPRVRTARGLRVHGRGPLSPTAAAA